MKHKKTKLERIFAAADKIATATFKRDGRITTGWICETDDGDSFIIYTPWFSRESKVVGDAKLRQIFSEKKVARYVHLSEAWLETGSSVDRPEAIILMGEDRDTGQLINRFRYILRPTHGAPTLSWSEDHLPVEEGDRPIGRFCNMFEPRPGETTHQDVKMTHAETEAEARRLNVCPHCGKSDGIIYIGRSFWGYSCAHKVKWLAGWDLSVEDKATDEQCCRYNEIGLGTFKYIGPDTERYEA